MKTTTKLALVGCCLTLAAGAAQAASARDNWENLCSSCHGTDGKAQNKMGRKLKIKDLTTAKAQARMKDAEMLKTIAEGVVVDGKEKMKAFKAELTPDDMKALVAFVRTLKD
jgi:cytochrome c6